VRKITEEEPVPSTVYKGCEGDDVTLCQERLNIWNYICDVDGDFGRNTETAVMEFQSDHALVPDGVVGDQTWGVLLSQPGGSLIPAPPYSPLFTAILCEASWYLGWDYTDFKVAGATALVARASRVVPTSVVWVKGKKTDTVCSVQLGGILGCVYDKTAKWSTSAWGNIQIFDAARPWSMIDELIAAGVGKAYSGTPQVDKCYAFQGWKGLVNGKVTSSSSGHQIILVGPNLVLESTTWTDEDGDGNSTDPGASAWRHREWAKTVSRYDEVRLVELNPL
jgi:peptidoglycan hydrolase-like protein with peptidoglycan-binding domain